ncbi:MAG: hypothetical protein V3U84_02375, partial [Thiotrichaceae bacterium]
IRFINGFFYILGGTGNIQYSKTGQNWTTVTPAGAYTGSFQDIARDPSTGTFVIVGSAEEIQTAGTHADGHIDTTLTQRTPVSPLLGSGGPITHCFWVENQSKFFIGWSETLDGGVQSSSDGTTWVSSNESGNVTTMTANDDIVAIAKRGGAIQYTTDGGSTWVFTQLSQVEGEPISVNKMNYDPENQLFVITGEDPIFLSNPSHNWSVGFQRTADFITYTSELYVNVPEDIDAVIVMSKIFKSGDFYILSSTGQEFTGGDDRYVRISELPVDWSDIEFNISSSRVAIGGTQQASAEGNGITLYGGAGVPDNLYKDIHRITPFQ